MGGTIVYRQIGILGSIQILHQNNWGRGVSQNADTADARGGVTDKMLTLGSGVVWKLGL